MLRLILEFQCVALPLSISPISEDFVMSSWSMLMKTAVKKCISKERVDSDVKKCNVGVFYARRNVYA